MPSASMSTMRACGSNPPLRPSAYFRVLALTIPCRTPTEPRLPIPRGLPSSLPSTLRRSLPLSSMTNRGRRSRNSGSIYLSHRSRGSRMWPSASTALYARVMAIPPKAILPLPDRWRVEAHPPRLLDDQRGDRVEMRCRDPRGAGERLHRGQQAVDLGWAIALEILQHRRLVRRARSRAIRALGIEVDVDAVRGADGQPLAHQPLGQREELRVTAEHADRLAGQGADRAGAEVTHHLVPDVDADRRGQRGRDAGVLEGLRDRLQPARDRAVGLAESEAVLGAGGVADHAGLGDGVGRIDHAADDALEPDGAFEHASGVEV